MPIRRNNSGLTSASISSFLSGSGSKIAALRAQNEDALYNDGQMTDAEYIAALGSRKRAPGVSKLQAAQLQARIDDLNRSTTRQQIKTDIELGKSNYSDLLNFEEGELKRMVPGSVAYNGQLSRVDSVQGDIVKLARQRIKQAIDTRTASPRDLAQFERGALDVFDQGTPAYEAQLAAVQDADRQADKFEYNQIKSREDSIYEGKLNDAKRRGDSYGVSQLVQEHNQVLLTRVQDKPEFFQNADGSPDANYYTVMNKVNTDNFMSTSFAQTQADKAKAAGDKALNSQVSDIKKAASIDESRIKGEIDDLLKGRVKGLDAKGLATAVAQKQQELANAQGAAANSLAEFAPLKPELIADVNTYNNNVKASLSLVEQYAKVANAGDAFVLYDPTDGSMKPIVATGYDQNGMPIAEGAYGDVGSAGKQGYLQNAEGTKTIVKGGDGVVEQDLGNGRKMQVTNYNGQAYFRQIGGDSTATNTKFVPMTDADKVSIASTNPALLRNAGFAPEEIIKMVQGQPQAVVDQVTSKLSPTPDIPLADTPAPDAQAPLKVNDAPAAPDSGLSDKLQIGDLKVQTEKTQRELAVKTQEADALGIRATQAEGANQELHAKLMSTTDMIKQLNDQVASGGANASVLQKQILELQKQGVTLQKAIDAAKIQGGSTNGAQLLQPSVPGRGVQDTKNGKSIQGGGQAVPAVPGVKQAY